MAAVKITPRKTDTIVVTTDHKWVSNGHWAIRLDCVANAALFDTEATIRAAFDVNDVRTTATDAAFWPATQQPWIAYTSTRWLYEDDRATARLFLNDHNGHVAFVTADLKMLGMNEVGITLYGTTTPTSPFYDAAVQADVSRLLMPYRIGALPGAKKNAGEQ